jgi:hypothetical protein
MCLCNKTVETLSRSSNYILNFILWADDGGILMRSENILKHVRRN